MDANRRWNSRAAGLIAALLLLSARWRAQQDTGVLLFTETEQIPLKTYAEFMRSGILRITSRQHRRTSRPWTTIRFIRCRATGWGPVAVMAASEELFTSRVRRAADDSDLDSTGRRHGSHGASGRSRKPERIAELHRGDQATRRRRQRVFLPDPHLGRHHSATTRSGCASREALSRLDPSSHAPPRRRSASSPTATTHQG